eukprot:9688266-Ditylum_brightwellii.AAC.1
MTLPTENLPNASATGANIQILYEDVYKNMETMYNLCLCSYSCIRIQRLVRGFLYRCERNLALTSYALDITLLYDKIQQWGFNFHPISTTASK